MEQQNYEVIQIDESTWSIEDGFVRFFLLKGTKKALLIDSGIDIPDVKQLAFSLLGGDASLPLELLNTHADGDHCMGNRLFSQFYMHEGDAAHYRRQFGEAGTILPVKEGDVIDLGDRPLEIIGIPGHTMGSIAILDRNRRALFPGDSVQTGDIFMFGAHRDLDELPASLIKLQDMEESFDVLYPSHGELKLDPDYIGKVFDGCERMMHGEIEPEKRTMFDGVTVHAYDAGDCTFLVDIERVFEGSEDE